MTNPIIRLQEIRKTYVIGKVSYEVLRGINLEVYPQDFLAIMGPSGGGKSTLLNILGLLDKPTSGSYLFGGIEVSTLKEKEMARIRNQRIGFVFQAFHLVPWASALENVILPVLYRGDGIKKEDIRRAEELLARVGLGGKKHLKPAELSGGEQQRVAIVRALINRPILLLADEPTGNLDSKNSREVLGLLKELNEEGLTIIMVTHDPEVAKTAKEIKYLRDGVFVES